MRVYIRLSKQHSGWVTPLAQSLADGVVHLDVSFELSRPVQAGLVAFGSARISSQSACPKPLICR